MSEDTQLHTEDLARPTGAPAAASAAPMPEPQTDAGRTDEAGLPAPEQAAGTMEDPNQGHEPDPGKGGQWAALLGDTSDLSSRWLAIQAGFVDEPRRAVEEADGLVAELIQRLARTFAAERARLEEQWSRGSQVSTEDLRVSLRTYRTFFNELLHQPDAHPV